MTETVDDFVLIPKGRREVIRIARESRFGNDMVDVRIWYYSDDGELRPTPKGISIAPNKIDDVISGLAKANLKLLGRGALLP